MNHLSNPDLERHVLGCVIEDRKLLRAAVDRGLNADAFTITTHRRIFECLCALETQNTPIDAFAIAEYCGCDADIVACLADCLNGAVLEFAYVMSHVALLLKKERLRVLQRLGEWLLTGAGEVGADPSLLAQTAVTAINEGRAL